MSSCHAGDKDVQKQKCAGTEINGSSCVVFIRLQIRSSTSNASGQTARKAPPVIMAVHQTAFLNIWFHLEAAGK